MRTTRVTTVLSFLVLVASTAQGRSSLEVGQAFPRLLLPSIDDGRPLSIEDFRGQKLMLHVWASW